MDDQQHSETDRGVILAALTRAGWLGSEFPDPQLIREVSDELRVSHMDVTLAVAGEQGVRQPGTLPVLLPISPEDIDAILRAFPALPLSTDTADGRRSTR